MPQTILVIDDKFNVQTLLSEVLTEKGFQVVCASNGRDGLIQQKKVQPDLILLDIMMPHMDGYQFITELRKTSETPVIMITAKQQESDVVKGFELGADDYITKPFKISELLMRVKAVLKRTCPAYSQGTHLKLGPMHLNTSIKELSIDGTLVDLTPAELSLVTLLLNSSNHTVPKAELCTHLINEGFSGSESTLKIHIRNIRTKLEPYILSKVELESVFGIGYRLKEIS